MKFEIDLPDVLAEKWRLKKQEDGYGDKRWIDYIRYLTRQISLEQSATEILTGSTREMLSRLWMQNYALNIPLILKGKKISDAPRATKPALIVGAGPSVNAKNHLRILKDWILADSKNRDRIIIIATDRMLIPLIEAGIFPEYALTVDGNREKIVKWYEGDLVNSITVKQGICLSNTVAPNVAELLTKKGVPIYWFLALLDDFNLPTGITKLMFHMTTTPALGCGGNSGTGAWAFANSIGAPEIAAIGLDFGYLEGTPIEQTAYYETLQTLLKTNPEALNGFYKDDYNPDFGIKCYTDVMFQHYKSGFVEMLTVSKIPFINCTEGGIVYGTGIRGTRFLDWLKKLENHKILVAPLGMVQ